MGGGEKLTAADVEAAFRAIVPASFVARLEPQWGTARVVASLKPAAGQMIGQVGEVEDGPYSDGENPEYWSRRVDRIPAGAAVTVKREVRATGEATTVREGRVVWNQLANMATFAAIALRREGGGEPLPPYEPPGAEGEQTRFSV